MLMLLIKPALGFACESVGQFQKAAAGEELAGIGWVNLDFDLWSRFVHLAVSFLAVRPSLAA